MITAHRFQHVSSGGLALAVHALFVMALMLSVSWKNPPQAPVEAELWRALPHVPTWPSAPLPAVTPPPESVPPTAKEAEIALKKAEKARREQEAVEKLEAQKRETQKREIQKREVRKQEEKLRQENRLAEEKRQQEEAAKQEKLRKQRELVQEMARQRQAELEEGQAQVRAMQQRLQQQHRDSVILDFRQRIQSKVQSLLRVPPNVGGNPEAVFQVTVFANGEIRAVTLVKSSGQPEYDVEVERAILRASPLPLPAEKEAAAAFRQGLVLKFRPFEDAVR